MNKQVYKIYLAGPIQFVSQEEAEDWREYAMNIISMMNTTFGEDMFGFFDPCRGKDLSKKYGIEDAKPLVMRDLADIRASDVVLMNIPSGARIIGTACELMYVHMIGVPVVIVCDENDSKHPWIHFLATKTFRTLDEAINWIADEIPHWPERR